MSHDQPQEEVMNDDEAWRLERRFWLEGASIYQELLDPQCVMAFAEPAGVMQGSAITSSLEGAPRWTRATMTQRTVGRPDAETIVLGYRAEAERTGSNVYRAFCTSTYRCRGGKCKLIQHQQTPVQ